MANLSRNFTGGKMNKVVDERLVPNGEYIDALNIRMGSTENSEVGVIENSKGNVKLSTLLYVNGTLLSANALCIGAIEDSATETIYWFVHDPSFTVGATGKLDMIVSYNMNTNILVYHIISVDDGGGVNTTLNFNPQYLITGVNKVDDLIFFTDDYNQPRVFNTKRYYPVPAGNIDQFLPNSILVIKKPPLSSPTLAATTIPVSNQENYMEERFICFAYRYKYADGEYSATSQWSEVFFSPDNFKFERDSFLNSGMINKETACDITFNSGDSLVVGIDILCKDADSNVIKVIEKLDKALNGYADNTNYTYTFTNSKIFTILPESELLRLYDNVPRLAKAQTIMGNRLMYGNYVDGYDLIDKNGDAVKLEYQSSLLSQEISTYKLTTLKFSSTYTIDGIVSVPNSIAQIDLGTITCTTCPKLKAGGVLTIRITLKHHSFTSQGALNPIAPSDPFEIAMTYQLSQDYASAVALIAATDFQDAVGTFANISTVANACINQNTFTDNFNCEAYKFLYLSPSGTFEKYESGITATNEPIATSIGSPASSIRFQIPAMRYVDNTTTPTDSIYEYFEIQTIEATYQVIDTIKSLHSNRDYEIGIVYMDEFNRATTALVSQFNTVHIPCSASNTQNSIRVTIPPTQIAPSWATRYKFVIKPDKEGYESIYTNIYYPEQGSQNVWFLLEGENARKAEIGDRYIVKADSNGSLATCAYATVLDKDIKPINFFQAGSPAGVYIRILPTEFAASQANNQTVQVRDTDGRNYNQSNPSDRFPRIALVTGGTTIQAGDKIQLSFQWRRRGTGGNGCEARNQDYNGSFIASFDYATFKQWWDDNVPQTLNDAAYNSYFTGAQSINTYIQTPFTLPVPPAWNAPFQQGVNYFQFDNSTAQSLWVSGTLPCSGSRSSDRRAYVTGTITLVRGSDIIIFETLPLDSNPDIFYENNLSFEINNNGEHQGNVQNQVFSTNTPAIVDTGFFNCYAFGNGAESYKIRDSIIGKRFNLGNRVTSVSAQDYKEADRYADITYSGIYNNESNVNKLNEFNLGLLNYKALEDSFGPIYKMDGRETDVLVLQEDKISYVLAGKNLLSDATAGGAITSVPEVLGTQIARLEKYGISFNPESYVQWGYDRFFTDVKRGAVIQIRGNSYSSDQLKVASEQGMRTWFRDTFISSFNTQKLGGFDPYMNEYVLSINDRELAGNPECVECGVVSTFVLSGEEEENVLEYCVDLTSAVGAVTFTWSVVSSSTEPADGFEITLTYGTTTVSSGFTKASGSLGILKDDITNDTATVSVNMTGSWTLTMSMSCPQEEELTIIEVVLTNDIESGQATYAQYRYINGSYTSPLQTRFVTFLSSTNNPLVSWYNSLSGTVGTGGFPPSGSTMRLINNKIPPAATWSFNPVEDKFKYHRSNVLYANNNADITTLLSLATTATPVLGSAPVHYADFTVPSSGDYLYLIWDYRTAIPNGLCYTGAGGSTIIPYNFYSFDMVSNFGSPQGALFIQAPSEVAPTLISFPSDLISYKNTTGYDIFGPTSNLTNPQIDKVYLYGTSADSLGWQIYDPNALAMIPMSWNLEGSVIYQRKCLQYTFDLDSVINATANIYAINDPAPDPFQTPLALVINLFLNPISQVELEFAELLKSRYGGDPTVTASYNGTTWVINAYNVPFYQTSPTYPDALNITIDKIGGTGDFTAVTPIEIPCAGTSVSEVCCGCESCDVNDCITVSIYNPSEENEAGVIFYGGLCDGVAQPTLIELEPLESTTICVINTSPLYEVSSGNPIVSTDLCNCNQSACYYYLQITSNGWDNANPIASSDFTGWTIDGLDFVTSYAAVMAAYGVNTSQVLTMRRPLAPFSSFTVKNVIVWFSSQNSIPPSFIGDIRDELDNPISYSWGEPTCQYRCLNLEYRGDINTPPVTNTIETIFFTETPFANSMYINILDTYGSTVDASNPVDLLILENHYRSIYGPQVTVSSSLNGVTGGYDVQLNNVPYFLSISTVHQLESNDTPTKVWGGAQLAVTCPSGCEPDPIDFNGVSYNGVSDTWGYVTQQVTGTTMPINLRLEWDTNIYYPCVTFYYRIDAVAPVLNPLSDPISEGFTQVILVPPSTSFSLPTINAGEYLSLAVYADIVGVDSCGQPPSPNGWGVPVILRNETQSGAGGCIGQIVDSFIVQCTFD